MPFHWRPKDVHRLRTSIVIRTFIVLAGLQNQCYRVTDFLLMRDALPSYRNGVLSLNRIALLFNLILSVYRLDSILPSSLNLCFLIDLVLS